MWIILRIWKWYVSKIFQVIIYWQFFSDQIQNFIFLKCIHSFLLFTLLLFGIFWLFSVLWFFGLNAMQRGANLSHFKKKKIWAGSVCVLEKKIHVVIFGQCSKTHNWVLIIDLFIIDFCKLVDIYFGLKLTFWLYMRLK